MAAPLFCAVFLAEAYGVRIRHWREVAGAAEADRARRDAGGDHPGSRQPPGSASGAIQAVARFLFCEEPSIIITGLREKWSNGDRRRIVCDILPARGARRQPAPHGLFWHILVVTRPHPRARPAATDLDWAITRRAGSLPAEELSAVAADRFRMQSVQS
jgi:hypothetical protein